MAVGVHRGQDPQATGPGLADAGSPPAGPEAGAGPVSLRRARLSDRQLVGDLFREGFEINFGAAKWRGVRSAVGRMIVQAIAREALSEVIVAEVAGRPAGFIWWRRGTDEDGVPSVRVVGLGVVRELRGLGIAKILVSALQDPLRRGARKVVCQVSPYNEPVIRLLEQFGAEPVRITYQLEVSGYGR